MTSRAACGITINERRRAMDLLTNIVEQLINGLRTGSIYALIALGYTMVYGIAKMINFAHGILLW